jgi:hypothetical protein
MDWLFWQWEDTGPDGLADILCAETVRPSAAELLVIKLTYEGIAGLSNCAKCGASLNRPLRLSSGRTALRHWQVVIATRCSGWQRHRHSAVVTDTPEDLLLGTLHL